MKVRVLNIAGDLVLGIAVGAAAIASWLFLSEVLITIQKLDW